MNRRITSDDPHAGRKASIKDYFRTFSYSSLLDRLALCVACTAAIGAGVTMPLMNVVFGRLTGNFTGYFVPGSSQTEAMFKHQVSKNALLMVYLGIARGGLDYISMFCFRIISIRISANIRLVYLRALFQQPISTLDKLPPGQAASTITSSANTLQTGISEKLSQCIQAVATVVAAYTIAFTYSWQLTLVTSSILLFILLVYGTTVPIMIRMTKSMEDADGKATAIASEGFGSIRMIVACGAENRVASRYSQWVQEAKRRGLKTSPLAGLQLAPIFFSMMCTTALAFWYGVRLYSDGHINSINTIIIVLMSTMTSVTSLGNIAAPIFGASRAASAASGFYEIIDSTPNPTVGVLPPHVSSEEDIVFENVTFAYPSRPRVKTLDGLSVRFEKGKITAIVGPSGSGKSTIVGLLEAWYSTTSNSEALKEITEKPTSNSTNDLGALVQNSGSITVGGRKLDEIDIKWWRSQIGLVEQNPFLFNDTIYANVANGLAGSRWENEDIKMKQKLVEGACREAYAEEFIKKLPQGYETHVGEGGIKLSGGQRQRLAIARSIVKRPAILILDEATSSIDVRGERIVQAALDQVSRNRTTITIAHRLSTIKKADNIVVMRNGKIVEQGNHELLVKNEDGVYFGLVHAQKLSMDDPENTADNEIIDLKITSTGHSSGSAVEPEEIHFEYPPGFQPMGITNSILTLFREQDSLWKMYIVTLISAMMCGTAFPLQSYIFAHLINIFTTTGQALIKGSEHWSLMFFILACCLAVSYFLIGYSSSDLSMHISFGYRQEYFESILSKPIQFFDDQEHSAGTLVSLLANDPTQLQQLLGTPSAMASIGFFNLVGCVAISLALGWKLALVSMVSTMPVVILAGFVKLRFEMQFEQLQKAVFQESSQFASEAIGAFRTVTALTLEDKICNRYDKLLRDHVSAAVRKARFSSLAYASTESLPMLCTALTFWYGGTLMATREYTVTQFFVVYMAATQGGAASGMCFSLAPNLALASAAANRIFGFRAGKATEKSTLTSSSPKELEGGARIEFRNVYYQYPTRDVPVFRKMNMVIEKGQFAAIVGPSGCGKSTIISLLERFYEVENGLLLCDEVSVKELNLADYRRSISLVAQEPTLFQGSIRDNILLGVDAKDISEEELFQASKDAEIHDFVMSLPDGYGTDVGSKGIALSGGQKQRIAIARALLRKPRILLLDEATSSLDSESEKLVQASFERAGKGRTMIVVAHRLSTVQNADVIFVLGEGNGKVVENGTHTELLKKRGVYWQMCHSQALDR